jgi:hypothetical protein
MAHVRNFRTGRMKDGTLAVLTGRGGWHDVRAARRTVADLRSGKQQAIWRLSPYRCRWQTANVPGSLWRSAASAVRVALGPEIRLLVSLNPKVIW